MKTGLSKPAVTRISNALHQTCPGFDTEQFCIEALDGLDKLELKERVSHLIRVLHEHLPGDFEDAARVLKKIPSCWDFGKTGDPLAGFAAWPVMDYVGVYGLNHPQVALPLLRTLTPLFSAEFAIRPFIEQHTKLTLAYLEDWCSDPDPHVRRLVSEGTRPRLPWSSRLRVFGQNAEPVLALLEKLKDDSSDYVRRSVANHLNDLSKGDPERVLDICRRWGTPVTKERKWIVRHATRTLVKARHPDVFPLLGYTKQPQICIQNLYVAPPKIRLGESVEIAFEITSRSDQLQTFVVDYAVHLVKKNGERRPKVFKLKSVKLTPQDTVSIQKRHLFKEITTRAYYSGEQVIEVLINGVPVAEQPFRLEV